ncbi:MAG: DUF433 domain-containing protein [Candidatus Hydrogenedentes bacterium]|nr:DUF433 domain-containing protein [Candidatus Hydrogenedentota bacterium]
MSVHTLDQHIEITPGVMGGKPRIAGRRITVEDIVVWHERMGITPDEIASEYDLTLADIHAALAYYFDHREELDRHMSEGEAFIKAMKEKTSSLLQEKLQKLGRHGR